MMISSMKQYLTYGKAPHLRNHLKVACKPVLSGSYQGGRERKGLVGLGCILEFHIPDLRYIAVFVIFP